MKHKFFAVQEQTQPPPVESSLDVLEGWLNSSGFLDVSKYMTSSPTSRKSTLICEVLNKENAQKFCTEAAIVVADNIILALASPDSSFRKVNLGKCIKSVRAIADRKNFQSALGLSLLVHASKSKDAKCLAIFSSSMERTSLSIEDSPVIYEDARKLVYETPIKTILLQDTRLDESTLDQIETVFVSIQIGGLRGWCGPSIAVINLVGLRETYHLEHIAPMAVLLGHEMKHAIQRIQHGNDLNFSTPTKPDQIPHVASSESNQNREADLWFDLTAVGEKFRFHKDDDPSETTDLMNDILKGLKEHRVPALNDEQLLRYFTLSAADRNSEAETAFEYVPESIID
jgi:hypothetical protein